MVKWYDGAGSLIVGTTEMNLLALPRQMGLVPIYLYSNSSATKFTQC